MSEYRVRGEGVGWPLPGEQPGPQKGTTEQLVSVKKLRSQFPGVVRSGIWSEFSTLVLQLPSIIFKPFVKFCPTLKLGGSCAFWAKEKSRVPLGEKTTGADKSQEACRKKPVEQARVMSDESQIKGRRVHSGTSQNY